MPVVKKVVTKEIGSRPVLVEFHNSKIQPGKEGRLKSGIYETQDETKLVGITRDNMLYTGNLVDDELYNNFILIYNKKKDKIRLIQADHCVVTPSLDTKKVLTETKETSLDKSISDLNQNFGSKKARRATEQRQRLTMNIDTVKEDLEKTVIDFRGPEIYTNISMSLVSDTIEYSPLLTWKIHPKKCQDLRNLGLIPISTSSSDIQIFQNCTLQPITSTTTCHIVEQQHHLSHERQHLIQRHEQQHQIQQHEQQQHQIQQHEPQSHIIQQVQHQQQIQQQQQQTQCNTEPQLNSLNSAEAKKSKRVKIAQNVTIKKKFKRLPVDGMAYHSQQLGLRVPPKKTLGIKGMIIHSQAREVINNVFKFMKEEAHNGLKFPIANYRERVLSATGISKCTYSKITMKEFQLGEPQPSRRRKCLKVDESIAEEALTENDSIYRPKINRDASTRDGVYNLEDLVPGYILDTLASEAGQIMNMGTVEPFNLSPFPASSISKILMSGSSEEIQVRSITIFLYIHYLISYMITPMKSVKKKFVCCDKSTDVNSHILDNFSVSGTNGRTRPLHMKDKALCFILVLAAIALDYEVDVQSLSKDLKIGVKKTLEVSRILAFNASSQNKHVVQLKLPLPEPVSFNPKRKRKTL